MSDLTQTNACSPFYRLRVLIRMQRPVKLHAHHAATVYALLSQAYGLAEDIEPVLPDGLLPCVPEQCVVALRPDDTYAFGFTLIAEHPAEAGRRVRTLLRGLRRVANRKPRRSRVFWGNFAVERVEDLVAGAELRRRERPAAIPRVHIERECRQAARLSELTLRFVAPLRALRPKPDRAAGHTFFDRTYFLPAAFLLRLQQRLEDLGIRTPRLTRDELAAGATVVNNRLVWLDVAYGAQRAGKSLDGAMGCVRLALRDRRIAPLLVWGQYAHAGEATRFGHGAFRISELGGDPFACARSASLLERAFDQPELDRQSATGPWPAGMLRAAARNACRLEHVPQAPHRLTIQDKDGSPRELCIPAPLDMALQRALLSQLAPALDVLFEESSLAFRKGLGRNTAARRIQAAFRDGYRFAVRADFRSFFDSVDHDELADRLAAYLADDATVALIMRWVRSGAPADGRGLPTGAPLSPLLANLLLDTFDEQVTRDGGMLVRYADDFLILFRERDEADRIFRQARRVAESLQLRLNEDKSALLNLREPFAFLGFRFEYRRRWQISNGEPPRAIEDLGWSEPAGLRRSADVIVLPGEVESSEPRAPATLIVGPQVSRLSVTGEHLICEHSDGTAPVNVPLKTLRELVVIKPPTITAGALQRLLEQDVHVLFADGRGRLLGALGSHEEATDPETLAAQAHAATDDALRLSLGRQLVAAKLSNYATLADTWRGRARDKQTGPFLRRLAVDATSAATLPELLGIEGAGAARWYGMLAGRIDRRFRFERRVAPRAADPVNVILNIAQTFLHRQMILAARVAGLSPAIGIYHSNRAGHLAFASDVQEPFRYLMDRLVIEATRQMRPADFQRDSAGPFPLRIRPNAYRRLVALVYTHLARPCRRAGQGDVRSYQLHFIAQARAVRRWLVDPHTPAEVFEHEPLRRGL